MDSIQKVLQRIATIENRFQRTGAASPGNFAEVLKKTEQTGKPTVTASRQNISDIIKSAADRHQIDPKLAMAVAVAESGLEPQAVSPAGAVGVMQLMPETARSLGVRNINDPRDNIDGGVRYLKEMLTTFNGDITKAVAAYNAGPEAVKQYGGIPPYPETRAYVSKVLSLSS
jgi:soluble lytic murein transglycosylase-like protein